MPPAGDGVWRTEWNIPALAYRINVGDRALVFGTDQTGTDPRFAEFARGADLLVLHMTISGGQEPAARGPDVVGQVARDTKPPLDLQPL